MPDRLRDFGIIAMKDFGSILSMAKTTCSPRLGLRRAPGQKIGAFEQVFGGTAQASRQPAWARNRYSVPR
jgi:hypothetical protein